MGIEMDSENRKPNIQIDDIVREMTDEEYEQLVAYGWKEISDGEGM
jgi:hypothetical protein